MKSSVSRKWRESLQKLAEEGIDRIWIAHWAGRFAYEDRHYIDYYEAGFRSYELVKKLEHKSLTLSEVVRAKEFLVKTGIEERKAEELLSFATDSNDWWKSVKSLACLYEGGVKEEIVLKKFLEYGFRQEEIEELALVLEKEGFSKQEALYEIWHIKEDYTDTPLNKHSLEELLKKTQKAGFITPHLAYLVLNHKDFHTALLKAEVRTYEGLGLLPVQAEWWTRKVAKHRKLDKKEITKLVKAVDSSNPLEIELALYLLHATLSRGLSLKDLLKWYKAGMREDMLEWISYKFSLEEAKKWKRLGLRAYYAVAVKKRGVSPEEFEQLLELTSCSVYSLHNWLLKETPENLKEWIALGVKQKHTYDELTLRGIDLNRLKQLLRFAPLEEILELIDEDKDRKLDTEKLKEALVRKIVHQVGLKAFKL